MKHSRRKHGKAGEMRPTVALLIGTAGSLVGLALITLLLSLILYQTDDPAKYVGLFSTLSLVLTGIIAGVVITLLRGDGGFATASLSALACSLILLIAGILICEGRLPLYCIINYAAFVASTVLTSALIGVRRKKRHR